MGKKRPESDYVVSASDLIEARDAAEATLDSRRALPGVDRGELDEHEQPEADLRLDRIVALYQHSSTSYQVT